MRWMFECVIFCVLSHSLSRLVRARDHSRSQRKRGRGIFPIRPFVHSFIQKRAKISFVPVPFGMAKGQNPSAAKKSRQEPAAAAKSKGIARPPACVGRARSRSKNAGRPQHRFLKTQLMLFGIGLCQIFDDPDLGQQADREPAAALFGRTTSPVGAARTHLHARPLALSLNFKHGNARILWKNSALHYSHTFARFTTSWNTIKKYLT